MISLLDILNRPIHGNNLYRCVCRVRSDYQKISWKSYNRSMICRDQRLTFLCTKTIGHYESIKQKYFYSWERIKTICFLFTDNQLSIIDFPIVFHLFIHFYELPDVYCSTLDLRKDAKLFKRLEFSISTTKSVTLVTLRSRMTKTLNQKDHFPKLFHSITIFRTIQLLRW